MQSGLFSDASLAGLAPVRRLNWVTVEVFRRLAPALLPWFALPFVLVGVGRWNPYVVMVWLGLLLLHLMIAICCGLLGAMASRAVLRGLLFLALASLAPMIWSVQARLLIAPRDLWSWLGRSLGLITPVGALPYAQLDAGAGVAWQLVGIWLALAALALAAVVLCF